MVFTNWFIHTCVHSLAGPSSGPRLLMAIHIRPTSVKFSWCKPKWNQNVFGYMYLLLVQGHIIHSSPLNPRFTSVNIHNLPLGIHKYEFRVAGILEDGTFGRFSSALRVDQTLSGEQKQYMYIVLFTCAFLYTINGESVPIYSNGRSIFL